MLNVTHSIHLIEDIFTKTEQREMAKGLELTHPVHEPWEEVDHDNNVESEPPSDDTYTGALGGGVCDPTMMHKRQEPLDWWRCSFLSIQ
jgi:hypothetical protein